MPVIGGAAGITYAGGNTTEATTTSTSAVDLLSVAALSITAATPFQVIVIARKSTGAAAAGGIGLKLNTTVVGEAVSSGANPGLTLGTANNQAENVLSRVHIGARLSGYEAPADRVLSEWRLTTGASATSQASGILTAAFPTATITDVVIRGISGSTSVTLGADELHVYTLATS
jgi:hypothetical protein